jgi:ATP-dependent Clp protease ATP-binding subunit ClpA
VQIVATWTKIPVEKLSADDMSRLHQLTARLSARVIGQATAVATVARALQRARCGLKDPARPIATLLFAGPTGVGKTCLTNELADHLFNSRVRR